MVGLEILTTPAVGIAVKIGANILLNEFTKSGIKQAQAYSQQNQQQQPHM